MDRSVVIIGAGQAGAQTAASLRELGHRGPVTIIGDEPCLPYQRPPLSKTFLKEPMTAERLQLRPAKFYADRDVNLATERRVAGFDPGGRVVSFTDGAETPFDVLVLATGARPRIPPLPGAGLRNVFVLRGVADAEAIRAALAAGIERVAIVGGGYIGLEIAAALRHLGRRVTIIEAEERVLKRVASEPVSSFFEALHRENGVEIITRARVAALAGDGRVESVRLQDGANIPVDAALLAVGAAPNVELAQAAGLAAEDGVLTDAHGQTSAPGIYACGDCARFTSRRYGRSLRVESVQNAIDQAKCVAAAIAGKPMVYDPVPWFWSDQGQTKLQIAGLSAPGDDIAIEGDPASGSFAVEYRRSGRLVAVDAVNNARAHMLARRRIAEETAV
jgi:3-phenylpropionate/trans-cinnamate dioxygenase ferredoxin reductase subunit